MFLYQPLDQFRVEKIFMIHDFIFTNELIYILFLLFLIINSFNLLGIKYNLKLNNNILFIKYKLTNFSIKNFILSKTYILFFYKEMYLFVLNLVQQQIIKKGYKYFPIAFSIFLFILVANLLGMLLYSFTLTSHVIIAFTLSFSFFISILIIGIWIHRIKFLEIFIIKGAPKYLSQFLIIIEVISYFTRPFSLGIRLFANMMSGHTLLVILGSFILIILEKSIYIFLLPLVLILLIIGLELIIAILQTYVFTVLICIYLNDSLVGAH